ncbi:MAG TPA: HAMP domain-containing sensor histidine kinase [Cytophagaceae bacterium]
MKLIEKTTYYYLVYSLFIFSIGTILFYFLIKKVLKDSIDEALHQEKMQIIENLKYELNFEDLRPSENVEIKVTNLNKVIPDRYHTIVRKDSLNNDVHYRELTSVYFHDRKYYKIYISQSMAEADELVQGILPAEIILFLLLLIGVLFINRHISNKLWGVFYVMVDRLKSYNLSKTGIIKAIPTDIDEFSALNEGIEKMTSKIYNDYLNQKEFNENSSHELQTPLAIIRNKLEILIQSKNLDGSDMDVIKSIFDAVKRLNQLNKGLLLLSKIDNLQFDSDYKLNINEALSHCISTYTDQIRDKEIKFTKKISDKPVSVQGNQGLVEVLFNNLISNAIRHNFTNGKIEITLEDREFVISNTGPQLQGSPTLMFERFKKQSKSESSLGLGLSIVKKICDVLTYQINYKYEGEIHTISIRFPDR